MKTIGVGFIGAGDISLLHAQAINSQAGTELIGVYDLDSEQTIRKSQAYNCKAFPSAEGLIADPEIDAVFVLTPLPTHYEYARMALEQGKHTFIEKPVGVSIDELEKIKKAVQISGAQCMPGHNYIYEPGVNRARDLIIQDKLGKIVSVYILYNIHHPEEVASRYPGVIRQILTHHSYIMLYLVGKPVSLTAMKSVVHYQQITQEDLGMVTLQLENGGLAHFCASFAADDHAGDPWTMMIKVIGTKGATRFSYRDWVENAPAEVHSQTYSAYSYGIANIDHYFIDECIRKGKEPLSTLDDAIMAQKIVEGAEASISQSKHIKIE
jgi:predicted dehydrogenase